MTDPTNPTSQLAPEPIRDVTEPNRPDEAGDESAPQGAGRGWLLPVAAIALALLGGGTLVAAAGTPTAPSATEAPAASAPAPSASTPAAAAPSTGGMDSAVESGLANLADAEWISRVATSTAIPERALRAYAGAALQLSRTNPACGLGWNTLAAIGHVETEHATMNEAVLQADGQVRPRIVGVRLNGKGVATVADTDQGEVDGDSTWDRAVGPMQFLPSTWAEYGVDGNGDGRADIDQIDDAALTAATYLCATGGDLTTSDGWIAAISAYSPGADYNNRVAEAAQAYAAAN